MHLDSRNNANKDYNKIFKMSNQFSKKLTKCFNGFL